MLPLCFPQTKGNQKQQKLIIKNNNNRKEERLLLEKKINHQKHSYHRKR
jgi:hypothetical protein